MKYIFRKKIKVRVQCFLSVWKKVLLLSSVSTFFWNSLILLESVLVGWTFGPEEKVNGCLPVTGLEA